MVTVTNVYGRPLDSYLGGVGDGGGGGNRKCVQWTPGPLSGMVTIVGVYGRSLTSCPDKTGTDGGRTRQDVGSLSRWYGRR